MMTKIRTNGSNCTIKLSPPNGLAWAKAGVTNIHLGPLVSCLASGERYRLSRRDNRW